MFLSSVISSASPGRLNNQTALVDPWRNCATISRFVRKDLSGISQTMFAPVFPRSVISNASHGRRNNQTVLVNQLGNCATTSRDVMRVISGIFQMMFAPVSQRNQRTEQQL